MAWHRGSKLGFHITSHCFTSARKPPIRNPPSIINHNTKQSSKFTSTSNHPTSVTKLSSLIVNRTHIRHYRYPGSSYRCYHADRQQVRVTRQQISSILVLLGLGVGVAVCFGSFETIPYTKRRHFVVMSGNVERVLGVCVFHKMKVKFYGKVLPKKHPESVRVRMIMKDVVKAMQIGVKKEDEGVKLAASHLEGLKWEVLVVNNDIVNACCLPGGKIIVFTGLLKHFNTDEEIATIIGHEVGHVVARHAVEKITKNIWRAIGQLILEEFVRPGLADALISSFILELPFSRRMEIEADHIGLLLMAFAGYDPRVAPKVFEKMDKLMGGSGLRDYLSTHPSGKTRSKLLSEASVMQKAISLYEEAIAGREVDT